MRCVLLWLSGLPGCLVAVVLPPISGSIGRVREHPGDLGGCAWPLDWLDSAAQLVRPRCPRALATGDWLAGSDQQAQWPASSPGIYSTCQNMISSSPPLPGSFMRSASTAVLWRGTLRIPKRAIYSGSSLRERNWTGSSQLAWPLLHILDGQMRDWQCLVACMHAKKLGRPRRIWGSEEHPTAPVTQRMQQRRQPAALCLVRNGTHSTALRPCHRA